MNSTTLTILFLCLVINTVPAASQPAPVTQNALPATPAPASSPAPAPDKEKQGAMRVPALERASFTIKIGDKPGTPGVTPAAPAGNAPAPKVVPPNRMVEVEVTRFMPVQRNNVTWSNGVKTEDWFSGKYFLKKSPDGNWINTFDVDADVLAVAPYGFTTRHFFSWVTPATFVESGTRNGQPANHFHRASGDDAWIHTESGLPIEYSDGARIYTYTFGALPTSPPELSPAHAKELARYLQSARAPQRISIKQ